MKITNAIYDLIMQHCPLVPPETGGIIGGHGELITAVIFDRNHGLAERAVYCPDVSYLNDRIAEWNRQHIEFRGIFHSHPTKQCDLSGVDREYIIKIMSAMPTSVEDLFFPIISPRQKIYVYRAKREALDISIHVDCLQKV